MSSSKLKRLLCVVIALMVFSCTPLIYSFSEESGNPEPQEEKKEEKKEESSHTEESGNESTSDQKSDGSDSVSSENDPGSANNDGNDDSSTVENGDNETEEPLNEATPAPEPTETAGSGEEAPDTGEATPVDTEATPDPEEATPEASVSPSPEPTDEGYGDWRDLYTGWHGVSQTSETGMDIPIYYQTDWTDTLITIEGVKRSVKSSGCGITCLSMVIAYLTGNTEQNPQSLFIEAINNGCYWGSGWTHGAISEMAERYGVHTKWIHNNESAVKQALREGKPVIAHMGPGIFTKTGHYVVLKGIESSGKLLLNDPASIYKTHEAFLWYTLYVQARNHDAFCICWTDAMVEAEEDAIPTEDEDIADTIDQEEIEELPEIEYDESEPNDEALPVEDYDNDYIEEVEASPSDDLSEQPEPVEAEPATVESSEFQSEGSFHASLTAESF